MPTIAIPTIPRQLRRRYEPTPTEALELWHISVTRPGLFPMAEGQCPCTKAPCGHVIPQPDILCAVHTTDCQIFQAHPESRCKKTRPGWRRRRVS